MEQLYFRANDPGVISAALSSVGLGANGFISRVSETRALLHTCLSGKDLVSSVDLLRSSVPCFSYHWPNMQSKLKNSWPAPVAERGWSCGTVEAPCSAGITYQSSHLGPGCSVSDPAPCNVHGMAMEHDPSA